MQRETVKGQDVNAVTSSTCWLHWTS